METSTYFLFKALNWILNFIRCLLKLIWKNRFVLGEDHDNFRAFFTLKLDSFNLEKPWSHNLLQINRFFMMLKKIKYTFLYFFCFCVSVFYQYRYSKSRARNTECGTTIKIFSQFVKINGKKNLYSRTITYKYHIFLIKQGFRFVYECLRIEIQLYDF